MQEVKYIILGAGPSGLAFSHALMKAGENDFVILEKETEVGGLCRSMFVDGTPLDIGGGHFLDVKNKVALNILFQYMNQNEWQKYNRKSKIRFRGIEIDYPIESNIWQLRVDDQLDIIESIAKAGNVCGEAMPKFFDKWINWKLGTIIAEEYMLPYNRKIFSIDLNELGTYWLKKLPSVGFRDTIYSCIVKKSTGEVPAHENFYYPKDYGYGEVWKRIGKALKSKLITNTPVSRIDIENRIVNRNFKADTIINTIPWTVWPKIADIPENIRIEIKKLRYSSIDVDYHKDAIDTDAHWIYIPDEQIRHHRVLCRFNFINNSRGYWTETNSIRDIGKSLFKHRNEFAYPLNTIDKPAAITKIIDWAENKQIIGIGRWGKWEHMNSDVAVAEAMKKADELTGRTYG